MFLFIYLFLFLIDFQLHVGQRNSREMYLYFLVMFLSTSIFRNFIIILLSCRYTAVISVLLNLSSNARGVFYKLHPVYGLCFSVWFYTIILGSISNIFLTWLHYFILSYLILLLLLFETSELFQESTHICIFLLRIKIFINLLRLRTKIKIFNDKRTLYIPHRQ